MDFDAWLQTLNRDIRDILATDVYEYRKQLLVSDLLISRSYTPELINTTSRTPEDWLCPQRLQLLVQINTAIHCGHRQFASIMDRDALDAFPAWRLLRVQSGPRRVNWHDRWQEAGERCGRLHGDGWIHRTKLMAATITHPIWSALSDPVSFPDALGNPYAPFSMDQTMGTAEIERDQAERLALIGTEQPAVIRVPAPPYLPIEDARLAQHLKPHPRKA